MLQLFLVIFFSYSIRDETGKSEYPITNDNIIKELMDCNYFTGTKVYLPQNLSIVSTMNTSDQNVFVLEHCV